MMKHFIITVDTEGDNQWNWKPGSRITTHNAKYISRFQDICESYNFVPVYLTTYEMIMDDEYSDFVKRKVAHGKCEVGMHIHAWNSPPDYKLVDLYGGCPFVTEYPDEIIKTKLKYLKDLITERVGKAPVSFRSGRWATNSALFKILDEIGINVDCSITPGINCYNDKGMSVEHGNNYTHELLTIRRLYGNLVEIPMTTCRYRTFHGTTLKNRVRNLLLGKDIWLRPAINTVEEMKKLIEVVESKKNDYLEFMIHSTELMPGGSPYTQNALEVERLYEKIYEIFDFISQEYQGISLCDYYSRLIEDNLNEVRIEDQYG